jgi:hypothetical protein
MTTPNPLFGLFNESIAVPNDSICRIVAQILTICGNNATLYSKIL